MSRKQFLKYIETLLTVDGQGKVKKAYALQQLMYFGIVMGAIMGFCIGRLI